MCFYLCLLPLVLSVSTTEKRLAPLSSLFPIRYFYALIGFPLSFPFSRLNSPSLASPLIQKMLKCLDHLHDSSLRGVPSEGLQRMVQMFSILVSQERRQQRGSGCKLISASRLAYIDIVKGCLLLPVMRKQRQSLPRPGYSLNLYVARKNYCDNLVWPLV